MKILKPKDVTSAETTDPAAAATRHAHVRKALFVQPSRRCQAFAASDITQPFFFAERVAVG